MSNLQDVISSYQRAIEIDKEDEAEKIKARFALEKMLLSSDTKEVLDFHYACLNNTDDERTYFTVRAAFSKRVNIAPFLLDKFSIETSTQRKADIIHILGRIRNQEALGLAIKNLDTTDEYLKEVCLYVIGWTGTSSELDLLAKHLMAETVQKLKITAGSALRQVAWRIVETKPAILNILAVAFRQEQDPLVLARIIELMSTIAVKNLGIREDKNDPNVLLGDLDKAIIKTKKFLDVQ
jgi:hypothetical protein